MALGDQSEPVAHSAAEAIRLARRADELSAHRRPDVLDTLAAAYAEAGQFGEALAAARRALNLAQQQHQPSLAGILQKRIKLYEVGVALRLAEPSSHLGRQWRPEQ